MKGLLHSKRFKTNLRKWLFMYVGVMVLLTTVITYSKYISSLHVDDEARVAKFNIKLESVPCTVNSENYCLSSTENHGKCRPTTPIASCFSIDTSGLEVNSTLYLTFDYEVDNANNKAFDLLGVDILKDEIYEPIYKPSKTGGTDSGETGGTGSGETGGTDSGETGGTGSGETDADSTSTIKWKPVENLEPSHRLILRKDNIGANVLKFRVRMKKSNLNATYYSSEKKDVEVVKVGYIMEQSTTEESGN